MKNKIYTYKKNNQRLGKLYKSEAEAKVKKNEYLIPVWEKYKKVKVIDYCECCDQETGYHFEKVPVGKPIGFYKRKKTAMDMILENLVLDVNRSMEDGIKMATETILKPTKGISIKFRRYAPLEVEEKIPLTKDIK